MAVEDIAGSGPQAGNTGAPEAPAKGGGLDAALNNALSGMDSDDDQLPLFKAVEDKKQVKADAETTADKGDTKEPKPTTPTEAAAPKGDAALEAPKHWPEDRRKAFSSLAPDAQKALLAVSKDLEGGYTKKSMELSDTVKFADSIRGLFGDDRTKHQLAQAGLDEVGYVRYLHSLQNFATTDAPRYIAWAMQNLGVTPEQLGLGRQQQAQQQQPAGTGDPKLDELLMDPAVKQLRDEFGQQRQTIQQLQARLEAEDRQRREYAAQQQTQAQRQLTSMWTEFRSATDDHGQLAHPHADTLMQQMGAIMETDPEIAPLADGPAKLKAAYEAAIWARPALRNGLLEQEKAQAAAAAAKKAEAERAKVAAGPKRASGAPSSPSKKSGLDGALEQAFSQLGR